jgi:hypothetical protein
VVRKVTKKHTQQETYTVDIQDLGALGEILGAIGVVVTLIYLARQI